MTVTKPRTFSPSLKRRRLINPMSRRDRHDCELTKNGSFEANSDFTNRRFVSSSFRSSDTNDPKFTPSQNKILIRNGVRLVDNDPFSARNRMMEALDEYHTILPMVARDLKFRDELKSHSGVFTFKSTCIAATKLLEQKRWARVPKQLGDILGLEIGDKFQHRAELKVVGLHHPTSEGIGYVKRDGELFATSIVDSGRYENRKDVSMSDTLIYTGQGGNPAIGSKKPVDQKIEKGNRALMNSERVRSPVRVVYGVEITKFANHLGLSGKKLNNKIYVYDGLYTVDRHWEERGKYGKLVFKFLLTRMSGQQPNREKLAGKVGRRRAAAVGRAVVSVNDLSDGKEKVPIQLKKSPHDENLPPFEYITKVVYPRPVTTLVPKTAETCPCAAKNDGAMPYDSKGRTVELKPVIYECGRLCKCSSSCANRVTQNGISFRLEVFWCRATTRWGVRSRDYIPKGSFVAEYIGEVVHEKEAANRIKGSYLCRGGDAKILTCSVGNGLGDITIDSTLRGNVGRFVNHCDSPNLRAQCVLHDHLDVKMPHIMLFASKDIPPQQKLTMDYGLTIAKFGMLRVVKSFR